MLEADIQTLANGKPRKRLDTLESDIWKKIEHNVRTSRTLNVFAAWQMPITAFVLVGGIAIGSLAAETAAVANAVETLHLGIFSPIASLAPSTLLLGGRI